MLILNAYFASYNVMTWPAYALNIAAAVVRIGCGRRNGCPDPCGRLVGAPTNAEPQTLRTLLGMAARIVRRLSNKAATSRGATVALAITGISAAAKCARLAHAVTRGDASCSQHRM